MNTSQCQFEYFINVNQASLNFSNLRIESYDLSPPTLCNMLFNTETCFETCLKMDRWYSVVMLIKEIILSLIT